METAAHKLEIRLGNVLRTGVILAACVVVIGGSLYLVRHGLAEPEYSKFRGEPVDLRTVRGIVADAWHLRGRGIIQLGLLLLIATPIARVAFAGYGFARQRDWLYVGVASLVLVFLLFGLVTGI